MERRPWYLLPIIASIPYAVMLVEELFFDNAIDWYDLFWIGIAWGIVVFICAPFVIGFKQESYRDWLLAIFNTVGIVVLFAGILLAIEAIRG